MKLRRSYKNNISRESYDFIEVSKWQIYNTDELMAFTVTNPNNQLINHAADHSPELGTHEQVPLAAYSQRLNGSLQDLQCKRSSIRKFRSGGISFEILSSLLTATYSIVQYEPYVKFNVPSAGALRSAELYVLNVATNGLEKGIFHYNPYKEILEVISVLKEEEVREILIKGFMQQKRNDIDFANCSAIIMFASVINRHTIKYQDRGLRYAFIEIGAILQNVYLSAAELNVGCCANGGYIDNYISELIGLKNATQTVLLTAVIGRL